jgi:hypothetical protein
VDGLIANRIKNAVDSRGAVKGIKPVAMTSVVTVGANMADAPRPRRKF